eukprot:SAG11_NODE_4505_length_1870_cov_35.487860_3_plen_111_part_00
MCFASPRNGRHNRSKSILVHLPQCFSESDLALSIFCSIDTSHLRANDIIAIRAHARDKMAWDLSDVGAGVIYDHFKNSHPPQVPFGEDGCPDFPDFLTDRRGKLSLRHYG